MKLLSRFTRSQLWSNGATTDEQVKANQRRLWTFLFALSVYLDLSNAVVSDTDKFSFLPNLATALLAVALMTFANNQKLYLVTAAATFLNTLWQYPHMQNSGVMLGIFGLAICISWVHAKVRPAKADWFNGALPAIRLIYVLGYAAAALSKWNSAFFDYSTSCAVEMPIRGFHAFFPMVPLEPQWLWFMPWVVAIAEGIVAIVLAVPAFRRVGIPFALLLHLAMAFSPATPYLSFTAVVVAIAVLFLPAESASVEVEFLSAVASRLRLPKVAIKTVFAVFATVALLNAHWPILGRTLFSPDYVFAAIVVLPLGLILVWAVWQTRQVQMPTKQLRVQVAYFGLVVATLLMAMQPYFGFGNVPAFTMFSNLRTEQQTSNHYFFPVIPLGHYQDELVQIVIDSKPHVPITWFEFTRLATESPNGTKFNLIRGGQPVEIVITAETKKSMDEGWLAYKLVRTRPVQASCSW
jgi:hypothetical protein